MFIFLLEIIIQKLKLNGVQMKIDQQLLNKAKQIVLKHNNYSPSFLQRKLQVGYGLATNLIDAIQKPDKKRVRDIDALEEDLAVANCNTIMRPEGYIVGYFGSTLVRNIIEEVKGKLGDNLLVAKGMHITFYLNEDMSISLLNNAWIKIEELVNEDTKIVFEFEINNEISDDKIVYEVLLFGFIK